MTVAAAKHKRGAVGRRVRTITSASARTRDPGLRSCTPKVATSVRRSLPNGRVEREKPVFLRPVDRPRIPAEQSGAPTPLRRVATRAMPHTALEHHHRAERRFDRDRLIGFVGRRIAAAPMTARHDARRSVAGREFVETPRHVDALRRRRPRFGHEDLIRMQHAFLAAGSHDIRRQIAEQRRPADYRADQPQRRRMFD